MLIILPLVSISYSKMIIRLIIIITLLITLLFQTIKLIIILKNMHQLSQGQQNPSNGLGSSHQNPKAALQYSGPRTHIVDIQPIASHPAHSDNASGSNTQNAQSKFIGLTQVEKLNKRLRARNNQLQQSAAMPSGMLAPLTQRSFSPPSQQQLSMPNGLATMNINNTINTGSLSGVNQQHLRQSFQGKSSSQAVNHGIQVSGQVNPDIGKVNHGEVELGTKGKMSSHGDSNSIGGAHHRGASGIGLMEDNHHQFAKQAINGLQIAAKSNTLRSQVNQGGGGATQNQSLIPTSYQNQDLHSKIPKKIIVKKSRHIREASHDLMALGSAGQGIVVSSQQPIQIQRANILSGPGSQFGSTQPGSLTSSTPSQLIHLPPMIKTPKDRTERNQSITNYANLQPITPNINAGGTQREKERNSYLQQINNQILASNSNAASQQSTISHDKALNSNQVYQRFSNVQMTLNQSQRLKQGGATSGVGQNVNTGSSLGQSFHNNSTEANQKQPQTQLNVKSVIGARSQNKQISHEKSQSQQYNNNTGLNSYTMQKGGMSGTGNPVNSFLPSSFHKSEVNSTGNSGPLMPLRTFSPRAESQNRDKVKLNSVSASEHFHNLEQKKLQIQSQLPHAQEQFQNGNRKSRQPSRSRDKISTAMTQSSTESINSDTNISSYLNRKLNNTLNNNSANAAPQQTQPHPLKSYQREGSSKREDHSHNLQPQSQAITQQQQQQLTQQYSQSQSHSPNKYQGGDLQVNINNKLTQVKSQRKIEKVPGHKSPKGGSPARQGAPQGSSEGTASQDALAVGAESNIQFVDVQTLIFGENPVQINPRNFILKNHEVTKASSKPCGIIKAYAANTNQGIIRDYNEDRVSIILNIIKPKNKQLPANVEWPQICFFGVFDGHGGAACADYLRDNLHNFVIQNSNFPMNPKEAIIQGFRECEYSYLSMVEQSYNRYLATHGTPHGHGMENVQGILERSGSCGIAVMIVDEMLYIANVGDSRCLMSVDCGSQIAVLSRDHKPEDEQEKQRIQLAGGKIYRTQTFAKQGQAGEKDTYVQGPLRVFPGRLSVARTFGDIEAKLPRFGGNPHVIVCEPEIRCFNLQENHFDFIMVGCDGIFDRLNNRQVIDTVWETLVENCQRQIFTKSGNQSSSLQQAGTFSPQNGLSNRNQSFFSSLDKSSKQSVAESARQSHQNNLLSSTGKPLMNIHQAVADGVEMILKKAAASRSLDNITVLILGFNNFERAVSKLATGMSLQQVREQQLLENQISQGPFNVIDDLDIIPENFIYNMQGQLHGSKNQPLQSNSILRQSQTLNPQKPASQNSFLISQNINQPTHMNTQHESVATKTPNQQQKQQNLNASQTLSSNKSSAVESINTSNLGGGIQRANGGGSVVSASGGHKLSSQKMSISKGSVHKRHSNDFSNQPQGIGGGQLSHHARNNSHQVSSKQEQEEHI